jgi:DNA-binding NarL/FixJ family response regulator
VIAAKRTTRNRLRNFLRARDGTRLIGAFADPDAAEAAFANLAIDVALVSADGCVSSALTWIRELKFLAPALKIVLCDAPSEQASVFSAITAGATAYVTGTAPHDQFVQAIRHAAGGRLFLCQQARWRALEHLRRIGMTRTGAGLTERQSEVCIWLCSRAAKEVARGLDLSMQTVVAHTRAIYKRFGVHGRKELLDVLAVGC